MHPSPMASRACLLGITSSLRTLRARRRFLQHSLSSPAALACSVILDRAGRKRQRHPDCSGSRISERPPRGGLSDCPLLVLSGHWLVRCTCPLLMLWTAPPPARECHEYGCC